MKFINIEPGRFMLLPVGRDAVPHGVLHDKQPDLFQGFTQGFKLEAQDAVAVHVDIAPVVEHI